MIEITPQQLHAWLHANDAETLLLVDVREASECSSGMIPQAIHVPLANVSAATIPHHGKTRIVFQCRSGMRSQTACAMLQANVPASVQLYSLNGGILAWSTLDYPIMIP
jgi:hydroxyacylglutathione hydrolase